VLARREERGQQKDESGIGARRPTSANKIEDADGINEVTNRHDRIMRVKGEWENEVVEVKAREG
jgi:hypothetical protein